MKGDASEMNLSHKHIQQQYIAPESHLRSLDILYAYPSLRVLDIHRNEVENMDPLDQCRYLEEIDVSWNRIVRISGLLRLSRLRVLSLSHNEITTLSGLSACPMLESLDISHNRLRQLEGLQLCVRLSYLDASWNAIDAWSDLSTNQHIKIIDLCGNKLAHLDQVPKKMPPGLQILRLSSNCIEIFVDLKNLASLSEVRELDILENPFQEDILQWNFNYAPFLASLLPQLDRLDGRTLSAAEWELSRTLFTDGSGRFLDSLTSLLQRGNEVALVAYLQSQCPPLSIANISGTPRGKNDLMSSSIRKFESPKRLHLGESSSWPRFHSVDRPAPVESLSSVRDIFEEQRQITTNGDRQSARGSSSVQPIQHLFQLQQATQSKVDPKTDKFEHQEEDPSASRNQSTKATQMESHEVKPSRKAKKEKELAQPSVPFPMLYPTYPQLPNFPPFPFYPIPADPSLRSSQNQESNATRHVPSQTSKTLRRSKRRSDVLTPRSPRQQLSTIDTPKMNTSSSLNALDVQSLSSTFVTRAEMKEMESHLREVRKFFRHFLRQEIRSRERAATQIQACFRGFLVRKQIDARVSDPEVLRRARRAVRRGIQPPDHLFQIRSPPQSISSQPLPTRTDRSNRCVPPSSSHSESRIEILSLESIPVSHPVSVVDWASPRHRAAMTLQRFVRGYLVRSRLNQFFLQEHAAMTIQRVWRGFATRMDLGKQTSLFSVSPRIIASIRAENEKLSAMISREVQRRVKQEEALRWLWDQLKEVKKSSRDRSLNSDIGVSSSDVSSLYERIMVLEASEERRIHLEAEVVNLRDQVSYLKSLVHSMFVDRSSRDEMISRTSHEQFEPFSTFSAASMSGSSVGIEHSKLDKSQHHLRSLGLDDWTSMSSMPTFSGTEMESEDGQSEFPVVRGISPSISMSYGAPTVAYAEMNTTIDSVSNVDATEMRVQPNPRKETVPIRSPDERLPATFFQIHEEYKRDNSPTFSESGQGQDFAHEVDAIPDEDIVLSRSTPLLSSSVDIFSHRKVRRSPPPLPTEEEDKANDSI